MDFEECGIDFSPRTRVSIKIFGIGGGGCNAVNRLKALNVKDVTFIAANTDTLALMSIDADQKIALGKETTGGMGAGNDPRVGEKAAQESYGAIEEAIKDANLLFITAGMGGGTGTGGIATVAEIAKKYDILTIAVVTKPFNYEGENKMRLADVAIKHLRELVDVLVVVPNELAFKYVDKDKPMYKVIQAADDILRDCIMGVSGIVVNTSLINLDFADIRTAVRGMKTAHIGVGKGQGKDKVMEAFKKAVSSELLNTTIEGATNVIINMTSDMNVSAQDVGAALDAVKDVVDKDALIKHGLGFNSELNDEFYVTIVATGFKDINQIDTETENKGYFADLPDIDTLADLDTENQEEEENEDSSDADDDLSPRMKVKEIPGFLSRLHKKK